MWELEQVQKPWLQCLLQALLVLLRPLYSQHQQNSMQNSLSWVPVLGLPLLGQ